MCILRVLLYGHACMTHIVLQAHIRNLWRLKHDQLKIREEPVWTLLLKQKYHTKVLEEPAWEEN